MSDPNETTTAWSTAMNHWWRWWRRILRLSPLWCALVVCLLNVTHFQKQSSGHQSISFIMNETSMQSFSSALSFSNSLRESGQHQHQEEKIILEEEQGNKSVIPTASSIAPAKTPITVLVQQQPQQQPLSKVEKVIEMLQEKESSTSFRYYVYDHPNITRMDLRAKAKAGMWTWRKPWGQRLKDFALWEIRYLEALEQNTKLRTFNVSQADFIVIPIPMCAVLTVGGGSSKSGRGYNTRITFKTLYAQSIFQTKKDKHVFLTFAEQLFIQERIGFGMLDADYEQFRQVTVATVEDTPIWGRIPRYTKNKGYWDPYPLKDEQQPIQSHILTNHGFSIQWMGAATDPEHKRVILNKTAFDQKKNYFFYHTTRDTSVMNSTQFRHAPTRQNVVPNLLQPSSVGFDVPADKWLSQFQDSKFCLVIRGDMPGSRSMWRAIKSGCIPVIISDVMPYWAPIFRSMIALQDYSVTVDEMEFLRNPAEALNHAVTNLTDHDIEQKIAGLNLVQRLILPDEPDSLFVAAFGHETLASQRREYYYVSVTLYGDEHQVSLTF